MAINNTKLAIRLRLFNLALRSKIMKYETGSLALLLLHKDIHSMRGILSSSPYQNLRILISVLKT